MASGAARTENCEPHFRKSSPVQKFAESLVKCPKIEKFFAHKYWPEEKLPALYMPHCRDFTFRRGDFLPSAAGAVGGLRSGARVGW